MGSSPFKALSVQPLLYTTAPGCIVSILCVGLKYRILFDIKVQKLTPQTSLPYCTIGPSVVPC